MSRRDELISLARYGKVTPQQAEAEAKENGWQPFERQPELPAYDPMQESRWSIVQAIAWIAWRDLARVRENCTAFRDECTHWIFREWNEPIEDGKAFARRAGWFLESWREPTTVRLVMLDAIDRTEQRDRQMSPREAEAALWRALSENHFSAEAMDRTGKPVDIPAREWSYLKLFEDGKRDVLKYEALDRESPFTDVKLKREDLLRVWPPTPTYSKADLSGEFPVEPHMFASLPEASSAGYVPLCSALLWIGTEGGRRSSILNDGEMWTVAVQKLWPEICSGEIELIGLAAASGLTERIPGHTLALIKILPPLSNDLGDILVSAQSHISCTPYIDHEHWRANFNDCIIVPQVGQRARRLPLVSVSTTNSAIRPATTRGWRHLTQ